MSNPQPLDCPRLFDVPAIAAYPERLRVMHLRFGTCPGHTCGTCRHFVRLSYHRPYYKCDLTAITHGPGTDWRVRWPACGRWEAQSLNTMLGGSP